MARDRHPAVLTARRKRTGGSRNRDRKVTGFYEESLSVEGIPGFTSRRLSRVGGHGGLGGSFLIRNIRAKATEPRWEEGEATGVSEARSNVTPVGRQRPRAPRIDPPKRSSERRETLGPPVKSRGAKRIHETPTQRKLR
jgi:hypothetical protein